MPYEFIWWEALLCAFAGYCIGNLQFAIILSRLGFKDDVRNYGSGNAGSTNMLRVYGVVPALLTFIGDFCKGMIAFLVGRTMMGSLGGYLAALFAVAGHCWPVVAEFRGGKGVACSFGILWVIWWPGALATTIVGFGLIALTRMVSLGSLMGSATFLILALIFRHDDPAMCILAAILVIFIWVCHRSNIQRILHGEEKKLGMKEKK